MGNLSLICFEKGLTIMKRTLVFCVLSVLTVTAFLGCSSVTVHPDNAPYQTTGIKIGEVTSNSAIIWTRLSANSQRIGKEGGMPEVLYLNTETGKYEEMRGRPNATPKVIFPEGKTVSTIEGAVPGASGQVRVLFKTAAESKWHEVSSGPLLLPIRNREFRLQFRRVRLTMTWTRPMVSRYIRRC